MAEVTETSERGVSKSRTGVVVSNGMDKTVVVTITKLSKHAQYGKYLRKTKKLYAHDEKNECQVGDTVKVVETRPLSKTKRWRVQEIVTRAV